MASTKIYTRTGDKGTTSLVNGERVPKSHLRLEAYGSVDELNSVIGMIRSRLKSYAFQGADEVLELTQNHLFNLGSQLACSDEELAKKLPSITEEHILELEKDMDSMSAQLPELRQFILPGGNELASYTHLARTVCRRVERACCRLSETEKVPELGIAYLNRLNDYFFILARFFNHSLGIEEVTWKK